jgi:antitoxin component YwqK of YwqJK toxin-antitoxin module
VWKEWYPGGTVSKEGKFVDGKHDGTWTHWYESGRVQESGNFKLGVPDGPFETRSPTGVLLSSGSYVAGKREGPWKFLNEDGTPDTQKSGVYAADLRTGDLPAAAPAVPAESGDKK